MCKLAQQVRESDTFEVLPLDSFHQTIAHGTEGRVRLKMINENVGVNQNAGSGGHLIQRHRLSSGNNSGSSAKYSASSAVPLKPIMPYAFRSGLSRLLTSTRTRSPSFQGSGPDGLNTPFSYTASTVMDMSRTSANIGRMMRQL